MTPTTTPAPMTHEGALGLLDELATYGEVQYYRSEDVAALRAYIEAERTRADALAARIAELEAALRQIDAHGYTTMADHDMVRSLIGHKEGRDGR